VGHPLVFSKINPSGVFMSSEARKDRMIEAIKRIVLKDSQIRSSIIAIEYLHGI
jgi:hypothetical protein